MGINGYFRFQNFYIRSNLLELNIDKLTNFDAEIAVIGCLLWDNRSYEKISDFLDEQHFSNENNKNIYRSNKKIT